jgi:hypothetical protein
MRKPAHGFRGSHSRQSPDLFKAAQGKILCVAIVDHAGDEAVAMVFLDPAIAAKGGHVAAQPVGLGGE